MDSSVASNQSKSFSYRKHYFVGVHIIRGWSNGNKTEKKDVRKDPGTWRMETESIWLDTL